MSCIRGVGGWEGGGEGGGERVGEFSKPETQAT